MLSWDLLRRDASEDLHPGIDIIRVREVVLNIRLKSTLAVAAISMLSYQCVRAQTAFSLKSSAFEDGQPMHLAAGGDILSNPNCFGRNLSPALFWQQAPEGTRSFALLIIDPEGRPPGGVVHFVGYGIPASATGFANGVLSKPDGGFVGGRNTNGLSTYSGPCTPPGAPHHYVFTLFATDLEPSALAAGLSRDELLKAIDGHTKAATGLVGTFAHPH